jgi:hypothetical protein
LLSSLCVLRGLPVPVPTTEASTSVNATSNAVHHHSTHLSLHDSVSNTVDDLVDNINKIAIVLVVPKPHECPGLKILVPSTFDDPLVVLFPRGFYSVEFALESARPKYPPTERPHRTHASHSSSLTTIRSQNVYASWPRPPRKTCKRNIGFSDKSGRFGFSVEAGNRSVSLKSTEFSLGGFHLRLIGVREMSTISPYVRLGRANVPTTRSHVAILPYYVWRIHPSEDQTIVSVFQFRNFLQQDLIQTIGQLHRFGQDSDERGRTASAVAQGEFVSESTHSKGAICLHSSLSL